MKTYTVDGVTKTTTKDASIIVIGTFEGRTVSSLTRDEETLKQCLYDVKRLGWTDVLAQPFVEGAAYRSMTKEDAAALAASLSATAANMNEDEEETPFTKALKKQLSLLPEAINECPTCGSTGDRPCYSASGKRASRRHADRP